MTCIKPEIQSIHDKKTIQITVSGPTVAHLWHFGRRSAHHFLLPDFLLDEDTGHVQGAQQRVGLEPQSVALGRQQLQGVQCWVQVVAATQLDQQVHQRLTERGRKWKRGGEEGEEEGGREFGRKNHRRRWGEREKEREAGEKIGLQSLPSFSSGKENSNYFIQQNRDTLTPDALRRLANW